MARRRRFHSNTVRTVGALLPSDVLAKAMDGEGLDGLGRKDFGLAKDVRLRDEINSAWNEATALWWAFVRELRELPKDDATATSLTREKWLLPLLDLLGFDDVDTLSSAVAVGGTDYPISHMRGHAPLHLMGARIGIDDRASGIRGAARLSPHSLTQQFLNRSDDHLWGIVANGLRLRLLRDSVSLTRQAFVEFDLEAMFNGQVFSDFVLLYRVAHATRFDGNRPEECLLERWIAAARDEGIRALDRLRDGVEEALTTLGSGFLGHPSNTALRSQVEAGDVAADDLYRYLLRLVYRLLFLFVAEDRDLLHAPDATPEQRDRYERFYSTSRLRELSARPIGAGNSDLWSGLAALMTVFGEDEGAPDLGLPGLGSFLWSDDAIGPLTPAALDNEGLLIAIRGLAQMDEDGSLRRIDFASLGAEELGSVYESLLELHPRIDTDEWEFTLGGGAGSERKTTGSYYTPTELISELLESALMPVLERAASSDDPEQSILDLKVVDPAAGSGHFLIAAAHRIGKRLAEVRTGEPEPPEEAYRTALRDVISRCIYAVDINELAVELCKVSLWLEALDPGKPLSFLDHHVLVGNSLFGATPAAIEDGIPDDAFVALTGDDKKIVAAQKKKSRVARKGQDPLAFRGEPESVVSGDLDRLEELRDTDLGMVHEKERLLAQWKASSGYAHSMLVADAWCAAFAIPRGGESPDLTESEFQSLKRGSVSPQLEASIRDLAEQYRFFHWHLAFPQVFPVDPRSESDVEQGFDVVLGNPPWERVKLQEREFFATRAPEIASAPNKAARGRLIEKLAGDNPELLAEFHRALRSAEVESHFLRRGGGYPLCGRGDVNTYSVFSELMWRLMAQAGRVGVIVPTGIATDLTTSQFFSRVVTSQSLVSLYDFVNDSGLFPGIGHGRQKFCLMTLAPSGEVRLPEFAFFLHLPSDLRRDGLRFCLSSEEISAINPITGTAPVFRSAYDAELVADIYGRVPILMPTDDPRVNPWSIEFFTLFHMSGDSHLFRTAEQLETDGFQPVGNRYESAAGTWLPLYEGKMLHQFDHRFGDYALKDPARSDTALPDVPSESLVDPGYEPLPRYWVADSEVLERYRGSRPGWHVGWREVTNATNERTLIASALPPVGFNNKVPLVRCLGEERESLLLLAVLNSFVVDYCLRQKLGGTSLSYFYLKQIPVPTPGALARPAPWHPELSLDEWLLLRVVELVCTSHQLMEPAIPVLGSPSSFRFDPERRSLIRAEIDAALFIEYGLDREAVEYVLETFPILKKSDLKRHGGYRTKELVLDSYDAISAAVQEGVRYQTPLTPPPADPACQHQEVER